MKKTILFTVLLTMSLVNFAQSKAKKSSPKSESTSFVVDKDATTVRWIGKKVGGEHTGLIKVSEGSIAISNQQIKSASITIDMNSMTCTDIENGEYNAKLIGHLKNEDFFNTSKFPTAKLTIVKATKMTDGTILLQGNLVIKGKSNPVKFNATTTSDATKYTAKATLVFDRTQYDVKYGSTLFGAAADKAIENDVTLEINLVATKK